MGAKALVRHLARIEGVPPPYQLQLHQIADRLNGGCTFDEALRVAYIVYRLLRPAQVSH